MEKKSAKEMIFDALEAHGQPMLVSCISKATGINVRSIHWAINQMEKTGAVSIKKSKRKLLVSSVDRKLIDQPSKAKQVQEIEVPRKTLCEVLSRARELGGVFGIVMAQLEVV